MFSHDFERKTYSTDAMHHLLMFAELFKSVF